IGALAYCPDGSLLASTNSFESCVRIWDLNSGRVRHLIPSHAASRNSVAFSPDGRLLATADNDGFVKLWSAATGRRLARLDGHSIGLGGVAFSTNGRILAAIGNDTDVRLWDVTEVVEGQIDRTTDRERPRVRTRKSATNPLFSINPSPAPPR